MAGRALCYTGDPRVARRANQNVTLNRQENPRREH